MYHEGAGVPPSDVPQTNLLGSPLPASGAGASAACATTAVPDGTTVQSGAGCLTAVAAELDHLCEQGSTPITARRAWLETWIEVHPQEQVLLVLVRRAGALVAAAPLAHRRRCGVAVVRPLGDGPSDDIRFPVRDAQAARQLARGVQQALDRLPGPWVLVLRNLGPDPLLLPALREVLPTSSSTPGDVCPGLRLNAERTLRAHVPASHRKPVQRRQRRLAERHEEVSVAHLTDPLALAAVLPEVEEVCRRRDAAVGRASQMDDPLFRSFFRLLVPRLAARGEAELTTLRVGGTLVAYALCLLDGPARRLWHGRFDPSWESYAVGHAVNLAALQRALDDPACDYFDWMRGDEEYKRSLSDSHTQLTHLVAASGALRGLVAAVPTARRLVHVLRRLRAEVRAGVRTLAPSGSRGPATAAQDRPAAIGGMP